MIKSKSGRWARYNTHRGEETCIKTVIRETSGHEIIKDTQRDTAIDY
jgi:hypothetical protein